MNKIVFYILIFTTMVNAFKIEQEFNIKTIEVKAQNSAIYKEFYGKIVPDTSKTYDIAMRFDGFITKLYAPEQFTFVEKGDKLFSIYSESIYNLYDELDIAKNRSKALYSSSLKKFKLFGIDPKNKNGDSTIIKSFYSGYITEHNIKEGSFIKKGQKLFEITDISSVWALINIYQKDIEFVQEGMKVEILVDGIKEKYYGKVEKIYPTVNSKDQSISVRVQIDNKEKKLFPNMFMQAKLYKKEQQMLIIPKNALITRDGKQYVFFKDGKYFSPNEVVAKKVPQGYEIIQGLQKGDKIVSNALFLLDSDAITNGLYSDDW